VDTPHIDERMKVTGSKSRKIVEPGGISYHSAPIAKITHLSGKLAASLVAFVASLLRLRIDENRCSSHSSLFQELSRAFISCLIKTLPWYTVSLARSSDGLGHGLTRRQFVTRNRWLPMVIVI
jgi:hypothetical protein